jgi:hypothetical protein
VPIRDNPVMGDGWQVVKASEVRPGQKVRTQDGTELVATRIERPFMGRNEMLAFIEDTETRWFKRPAPVDADVEIRGD